MESWGRSTLRVACLVVVVLLAACQTPVRLMPTPVGFSSGEVDPFAGGGHAVKGTDVPVLYATNRLALVETPTPIFTALAGAQVRVGIAHVRIGDDDLDWETLHRLSTSEDVEERPVVQLDWLEPKGPLVFGAEAAVHPGSKAFFELVDRAVAASPTRELLVYVHGANNTLARAAAQAAQFRHFTGRRVAVLAFIWPSTGSILRYLTDVGNAAASVEPFAQLLEALAANTSAATISVLAYSAGAKVASPALSMLGASAAGEGRAERRARLRLRSVYYAAPDYDTRSFVDQMRDYIDLVDDVTVAANLRDSALNFARIVHRASRAGRPDPGELDEARLSFMVDASRSLGFDFIHVDPNAIPGLARRSHAFWYEHPWVSSDVIALLLLKAGPERRGLQPRTHETGTRFWTFPPDYGERVVELFRQSAVGATGPGRSP